MRTERAQRGRSQQGRAAGDQAENRRTARLGPRPLPLHLGVAAATWMTSRAAWPLWSSGLPGSSDSSAAQPQPKSPLDARRDALRESLRGVDPDAFAAALDRAIAGRSHALVEAVERYRRHPYRRDLAEPPVLWRDGPARLLDYGAAGDAAGGAAQAATMGAATMGAARLPLLVVPSLINRPYVLDLSARRSLLRWLAGEGFRPLLLDWGAPDETTRGFTLTDYVAGTLEGALDALLEETGRAPLLLGYCMGGLLALVVFAPALDLLGELPVDAIQSLFAGLDPELGVRKFLAFARLDPDSERAADFVALEDWLNDGMPLAAPVARECLGGWYAGNTPARGLWRIAGRPVEPAALELPSLVLVPANDRIVPPPSALALGAAIRGAEVRRPPSGHIGMVVSRQAPETVWRPLADWLAARAATG